MADFNIVSVDEEPSSSTTAVTSVPASATAVTILSANSARLGMALHNDSNKTMYLKHGVGATTSSFTIKISKGAHYEVPFRYTGVMEALWDAGVSGSAKVTEYTA